MNRPRSPLSQAVRSYGDAEALLLSRVRDDPRPYAERGAIAGKAVTALLERTGRPQDQLRFLHLAGSKGKGSVALMAEHLLRSLEVPTGTFTSPHLRRWNERIRVHGRPLSDDELCAVLELLRPHVAALDADSADMAPSFFDVITAAAMVAFARAGCETVVLETGLGGLYDATNVVIPLVSAITSIELEHTDKLGTTLAEVARHKAGIIKRGVPVVTAALPPDAAAVVAARAHEVQARELRFGRDWDVESVAAAAATRRVRYTESGPREAYGATFTCPHPAPHMAVNAGLALALVRVTGRMPDPTGLAHCLLPARVQVVHREPWIIVDGAHTPSSLEALAESLASVPATRRRFLVSSTRGKSLQALARLMRGAEQVWVTRADPMRSAAAAEVAGMLGRMLPGVAVSMREEPQDALAAARVDLPADALLCVCGSVYLAGFALSVLAPDTAP